MDLSLRNGFSEDQLKGLDYDAIVKYYNEAVGKASITDLEIDGTKTSNGVHPDTLPVEKPKAFPKDIATDAPHEAEVKFVSAEINGDHISQPHTNSIAPSPSDPKDGIMPIAIIGMSCRFPGGATNVEKFRELVSEGRSAWSEVPESRFNVEGFYHPDSDRTSSVSFQDIFCLARPKTAS